MHSTAQCRDASRARDLDPKVDASEREPGFAEIAPLLAHEAMNLVMGMRGLETLLSEEPLAMALARLAALEERVQRLGEHLAEYARADAFRLAEIDPRRILADTVDRIAFEDGSVVVAGSSHAALRAMGDEGSLRRALTHLIRHLIVRASPRSSVEVSLSATSDDRGERIVYAASALLHRPHASEVTTVFEPFHGRLGSESGLELPIARRVARNHGGDTMAWRAGDRLVLTLALPTARVVV